MKKFETISVAKAYELLGQSRFQLPAMEGFPEEKRIYHNAELDLHTFIDSVNKESNGGKPWIADFTNNEDKIRPWFWLNKSDKHPSGFVFSYTYYDFTYTYTHCGSRFVFHSVDAWRYAINTPEVIDLFLTVWTKKV